MTDSLVPERPIICPYDDSHIIAPSRIQKHLLKCAKNFPPDYKVSCPYNATHRVFKSEIGKHISSCPDHQHFEPIIYEDCQKQGATMSSVKDRDQSVIDCDESWDDDDESRFYPLLRPTDCLSDGPLDPGVKRFFGDNARSRVAPTIPMTMSSSNNVRPPRGFAEALMLEATGETTVEDIESVASFMGVGRGKPWSEPRNEMVRKIGRARGSGQATTEI